MFESFGIPWLIGIFITSALVVWFSGISLAKTTDVIDKRFNWGDALGGMIILAIVTDLPEVAVMIGAALHHNFNIATGNLLGGIAIQTVILVILDAFGVQGKYPLTSRIKTLMPILEATLVIAILGITIMSTQLPQSVIFWRVTPGILLIAVFWLIGIKLLGIARKNLPWQERLSQASIKNVDEDTDSAKKTQQDSSKTSQETSKNFPATVMVFTTSVILTFAAGYALEETGSKLAEHFGLSGLIFGATVLALCTSLPDISTGIGAMKLGEYELAFSEIFGGNAFLPVIFLIGTLISGKAILPEAGRSDIYLACLGILLTAVYIFGILFRPTKKIWRMGLDSFAALLLYAIGSLGLIFFQR